MHNVNQKKNRFKGKHTAGFAINVQDSQQKGIRVEYR